MQQRQWSCLSTCPFPGKIWGEYLSQPSQCILIPISSGRNEQLIELRKRLLFFCNKYKKRLINMNNLWEFSLTLHSCCIFTLKIRNSHNKQKAHETICIWVSYCYAYVSSCVFILYKQTNFLNQQSKLVVHSRSTKVIQVHCQANLHKGKKRGMLGMFALAASRW